VKNKSLCEKPDKLWKLSTKLSLCFSGTKPFHPFFSDYRMKLAATTNSVVLYLVATQIFFLQTLSTIFLYGKAIPLTEITQNLKISI